MIRITCFYDPKMSLRPEQLVFTTNSAWTSAWQPGGVVGWPGLPILIGSLGLPIVGPYTHTIFTRYYYFTTDNIPFGQKTHRTSRIHHEAVSLCCKIALSSMELDQGGCRCRNSHLRMDDHRLASTAQSSSGVASPS